MTSKSEIAGQDDLLQQALAILGKGEVPKAEHLLSQILEGQPANFDANHLLGLVRFQQGRAAEALTLLETALRTSPDAVVALANRANILAGLGRFDEALVSYNKAIALKPDYVEALYNRGNTLRTLKRFVEALASYDTVLALKPDLAMAWNNRGNTLSDLGRPEDAIQSYDRAIALKSDYAKAHNNKGNAQQVLAQFENALRSHDRAIALEPDYAQAHNNRATALQDLRRLNEALQSCDRAIALNPAFAEAHSNRGNILQDLGRLDEALQSYDRAITLDPDYAEAYWNKSLCNLLMGRFEEGWRLFEWRKKRSPPIAARSFTQPLWLGEQDIAGKTLFLYAEQGLGDTIQFCRYARLAADKGAKVIFSVQDALVRLLENISPAVEVVDSRTTPSRFDFHAPLLSLPLAFRTSPNTIPAQVPYLRARPERVETWKNKLGAGDFKIGICWQGNPRGTVDIGRSFPLGLYQGISKIPGVRLISLQKGAGMEQIGKLPNDMRIETLGDAFDDGPDAFLDSAAVMENLDLVITSDTAIAHLAGALGRPVWVALRHVPDWRWLLDRADSPWYPAMRLFRQPSEGDWQSVFAAMESQIRGIA